MARIRSYKNILLIILFAVALSTPILVQLSGYKLKVITTENRPKANMPVFNMIKIKDLNKQLGLYFKDYNTYFEDNFAFREMLIEFYSYLKLGILRSDPFPEKIIIGREGWQFLGEAHSNTISETKGILNFSQSDLDLISKNMSESMLFLDSLNIRLYLAIAPEKSTVYGDYLPIRKSTNQTKLDQVKNRLATIGCRVIDLKDDLTKIQNPYIFYKTDSHWNEIGGFLGSQTLMKRLKNDYSMLPVLEMADFSIDTITDYQGDNAKLLFLHWPENKYIFTLNIPLEVIAKEKEYTVPSTYLWNPANYERRYSTSQNKLKVLIFHDSFFREFPKFLSPAFGETVFIWAWWNKAIILNEKPDIVIYEKVERDIDHLLYPLK